MSTKNLPRSLFENGKSSSVKDLIRFEIRAERRVSKQKIQKMDLGLAAFWEEDLCGERDYYLGELRVGGLGAWEMRMESVNASRRTPTGTEPCVVSLTTRSVPTSDGDAVRLWAAPNGAVFGQWPGLADDDLRELGGWWFGGAAWSGVWPNQEDASEQDAIAFERAVLEVVPAAVALAPLAPLHLPYAANCNVSVGRVATCGRCLCFVSRCRLERLGFHSATHDLWICPSCCDRLRALAIPVANAAMDTGPLKSVFYRDDESRTTFPPCSAFIAEWQEWIQKTA